MYQGIHTLVLLLYKKSQFVNRGGKSMTKTYWSHFKMSLHTPPPPPKKNVHHVFITAIFVLCLGYCGSKKVDIQLEGTLTKYQSFRTILTKYITCYSPYFTGTSSGDEDFFSLILTSPILTWLSVSINNDSSYTQSK